MDKAGPYNLTLLTVQANEIRGILQLSCCLQQKIHSIDLQPKLLLIYVFGL